MQFKPYQAPVFSFYSGPLYKSVAREWGGLAFGYLFLMVFAVSLATAIYMQINVSAFFDKDLQKAMGQVPGFKIENGEFSTDVEMPYAIKDPSTGDTIVLIDTRENAVFPKDVKIKVSKTSITAERNAFETRTIKFAQIPYFDKETMIQWIGMLQYTLVPIVAALMLIGGFIFAAVQVFIYGLIGMVFTKILNVQVEYLGLVRLSVVAITPVMIIDLILKLTATNIPFWPLIAGSIGLGYLFFGVMSSGTDEETSSPAV